MNLKIIKKQVKDLIPYINNARTHDEGQVEQIAASIKEFGFNNPILLDGSNGVIAGHGRLMAAKKLGLKEVPCIELSHLSEAQKKAYILADNKIALNAGWDEELLKIELSDLDDNFKNLIGFSDDELNNLLDSIDETGESGYSEISAEAAEEVPEKVETKCKLGDIWQLGEHRLMCGDSTKKDDIDKLIGKEKIDMIFTDPPYGMGLDTDWFPSMKSRLKMIKKEKSGNKYDLAQIDNFKKEMINEIFKINAKEMFLWGADYYAELLPNKNDGAWIVWDKRTDEDEDEKNISADKMFGSCFELCWSKQKHKRDIVRVKWAGLFGLEKDFDKKRYHPTQKPILLIKWFLEKYSQENDVVMDFFGGSDSTLLGCEQMHRKCLTMELDPHYIDVAIQRWENLTGRKAVLIEKGEKDNAKH